MIPRALRAVKARCGPVRVLVRVRVRAGLRSRDLQDPGRHEPQGLPEPRSSKTGYEQASVPATSETLDGTRRRRTAGPLRETGTVAGAEACSYPYEACSRSGRAKDRRQRQFSAEPGSRPCLPFRIEPKPGSRPCIPFKIEPITGSRPTQRLESLTNASSSPQRPYRAPTQRTLRGPADSAVARPTARPGQRPGA